MLRWIAALLLIPFLDAVLLAVVVSQTAVIGWIGMVLLVVLTGLVGLLLVRAEGRRTIRKIQRSLARGDPPTDQLLDGAFLIAAGAFFLTPGLVTDLIALLLVLPPTRIPIRTVLKRYAIVPYADKKTDGLASGAVWTFGFPEGDVPGGAGGRERGSAGGDGGGATGSGPDDTYDLGVDDYSVDPSEPRSGSGDQNGTETGYTIDVDDPRDRDDEPRDR